MYRIKLSVERQNQIKFLWENFKSEISHEETKSIIEIDKLFEDWAKYKEKIISDYVEFR
jgi:hypothetical protein